MRNAVTSQIEPALALWSRGLSIIPVPRPDGHGHNGKVPVIAWRQYQARRPTEREIHAWFGECASNIAIITGEVSGVVVIDVDSRPAMEWAAIRLPYTPWQVLEHMRLAQWDILEFSRDGNHISPEFPKGYWPNSDDPGTPELWRKTSDEFRKDLRQMERNF